jgi:AcrR family transcriptional regulator
MNIKDGQHKMPQQDRAEKAINDIFEAVTLIVQDGNHELLNAREVSERSGYSIGNIYHYFEKIDDIFIHLLLKRRKKHQDYLINLINTFNPKQGVQVLMEGIVDASLKQLKSVNPKIFQFALRKYLNRSKTPWDIDSTIDVLIEPLIEARKRDQTQSFRSIESFELHLILKSAQVCLRSPFVELSPNAGSEMHRNQVVGIMVMLLGRSDIQINAEQR